MNKQDKQRSNPILPKKDRGTVAMENLPQTKLINSLSSTSIQRTNQMNAFVRRAACHNQFGALELASAHDVLLSYT
jgi:hypothetical protein